MRVVVASPGQGADLATPEVRTLALLPAAARLLECCSDLLGIDVRRALGRAEPSLERTEVQQPVIVALSLAAWETVALRQPQAPAAVVGHSLGELTAVTLAGALSAESAVALAVERGLRCAAHARQTPGGMIAVSREPVRWPGGVHGAGRLSPDLWVASFLDDARERALAIPTARPIRVDGPWHHPVGASLAETLEPLIRAAIRPGPLDCPWVSTLDAMEVTDSADVPRRLALAIARPTRLFDALQGAAQRGRVMVLEPCRPLGGIVRLATRDDAHVA